MHDYMSPYKMLHEVSSIKRAQWTMISLMATTAALAIGLSCYGAVVVNEQMNAISQSVAAQIHNHAQLQNRIVSELKSGRDADFYYPLLIRANNYMIRVSTFTYKTSVEPKAYEFTCPASKKYEQYLHNLRNLQHKPVVNNVFLFAGGHGLGKSYAAMQLGKTLSRFEESVVVISVPMNTFHDFNIAGALIERIESALDKKCYIVWTFDELDSYLMYSSDDVRDKTITQFAEYTGFVSNENRVLAFTMNNAEMFMHNYWANRERIENNLTHYEHAEDFRKALKLTRMSDDTFLQEGQMSRLYSFVGNKLFVYKPFNYITALTFVKQYLSDKGVKYTNATETKLFGDGDADRHFSIRELKIAMDDIVNTN
ncbi:hypothetical protein [Orgyia pseudotsugata single capsid nuclopolyhedrovirus]|nr:hypothetical protein [Orgyia pseudotsugata single capsid nuclopolyhedrovirus]